MVAYEKYPNVLEKLKDNHITTQKGPRSVFDNNKLRKNVATAQFIVLYAGNFPEFFDPTLLVSIFNHPWEVEDVFYAEHAIPHPIYEKEFMIDFCGRVFMLVSFSA